MATGINAIATEGEAKSKLGYTGSVDTNKCCTKARAIAMGADSSKLTSYKDNQLVKYSDIQLNKRSAHITLRFTYPTNSNGYLDTYLTIGGKSIYIQESMGTPSTGGRYEWNFVKDISIKDDSNVALNLNSINFNGSAWINATISYDFTVGQESMGTPKNLYSGSGYAKIIRYHRQK